MKRIPCCRPRGGDSPRRLTQSRHQREAEDFALKVEHDKRAHVFVDPKAGRVLFRDVAGDLAGSAPRRGPRRDRKTRHGTEPSKSASSSRSSGMLRDPSRG